MKKHEKAPTNYKPNASNPKQMLLIQKELIPGIKEWIMNERS